MRDGLRHILERAGGFEIVGEASDGSGTLALAERAAADVLLLDLSMPAPTGIELIRLVKRQAPSLRTLVLTMHAETQYAARAFKAGATGYLTKDSATAELVEAVGKVAAGGVYVSPSAAESLAHTLRAPAQALPHERLSARAACERGFRPRTGSRRRRLPPPCRRLRRVRPSHCPSSGSRWRRP
ncbi:hypothetical protein A8E97_09630 [Burkholderia cenocepacia]|nr:hypothetical protein A8E97_09630 [Burkholderia cenocepacia]